MAIAFLESITRAEYLSKLPTATPEEAEFMLGRYAEWQVLTIRPLQPFPRSQGTRHRYATGIRRSRDPFSKDILEGETLLPRHSGSVSPNLPLH